MENAQTGKLIAALQNPALYDHPVTKITLVETHISWVILTGSYAYKIKKPVSLGFLDFSTLALRKQFCDAELRLNQRLAPEFYLEVVAITGTVAAPRWQGTGAVIEYAVKMRQFPADMELERIAKAGRLTRQHIEHLAIDIAQFHAVIPQAEAAMTFGTPEMVWQPIAENFVQLQPCSHSVALKTQLEKMYRWYVASHAELLPLLQQRKSAGFIRECHGDMHLANMFLWQARVVVFDCLEFNPALRWIDVISEIAFLTMDLRERGHADLARCFLNEYLQQTGDYAGLLLLNYYQVYRAMVRAKVACIRMQQVGLAQETYEQQASVLQEYLDLARDFIQARIPVLFITHGVSGSGKTFYTSALLAAIDAVRVRADVERKRLAGLSAESDSGSGLDSGLYSADMSRSTYASLAAAAQTILQAGYHAIIDATFLQQAQREEFARLAQTLQVPLRILAFTAKKPTLQQRIESRQATGKDASEADTAVLQQQLARIEPLTAAEQAYCIAIDTDAPDATAKLLAAVQRAVTEII